MLVPVGVKYGGLQQTGRTAENRKEVKKDIQGQRWQIGHKRHIHRFSQSLSRSMPEFVVKEWKERVLIQGYTGHILNAKTLAERRKKKKHAVKFTCLGCGAEFICGGGGVAKTREGGCPGP